MPEKSKRFYDVIIVGGGPAGLSAALVLTRSRRSALIIDEGKQRNLRSHGLHNFLTRDGILPPDFLNLAYKDLKSYPVLFKRSKAVKAIKDNRGIFKITDTSGSTYESKRLLLATGVKDEIPEVPGMKELWGRSVFHCPFCDGYECRDQEIGLYAKKHNGYGMALALSHLSKKTTLFTDGAYYLSSMQRLYLKQKGIEVITQKIDKLIYEDEILKSVLLTNGKEISCQKLFTHHGIQVNRELLEQLGCASTKKGAAITNRHQQTNISGVYVAGDASIDMHFVAVAAAEGVKAAVAIHNDLLQAENNEELTANKSK